VLATIYLWFPFSATNLFREGFSVYQWTKVVHGCKCWKGYFGGLTKKAGAGGNPRKVERKMEDGKNCVD